jgi:hypothetical protein
MADLLHRKLSTVRLHFSTVGHAGNRDRVTAVTDCLKTSHSWEDSVTQTPNMSRNLKVHYRVQRSEPQIASKNNQTNKLRGLSLRANYTDRRLSAKLVWIEGYRVVSAANPLRPYSRISRPESLLCLSSSSSIVLTKLSGPCSRPPTSRKIWHRREFNPEPMDL